MAGAESGELTVIGRQFSEEFRVILDKAVEAVLHAGDIGSESLPEFLIDPLILLLDRAVKTTRRTR